MIRRQLRHDLRSPLGVLIGRADLILSEVQGPVTPAQRRSLEILIGHAERLSAELEQTAALFDAYVSSVEPNAPLPDS